MGLDQIRIGCFYEDSTISRSRQPPPNKATMGTVTFPTNVQNDEALGGHIYPKAGIWFLQRVIFPLFILVESSIRVNNCT